MSVKTMASVRVLLRRLSTERRHRFITRVIQQTGTSCGVACVAMLARLSFREAERLGVALLSSKKKKWHATQRTHPADLRKMLAALGWRLGRMVKCRTWRKVPPGALVAVQRKLPKDEWHWVVSDADAEGLFFLDPRKNVKVNRRRDFENARPSWYHRVTPL